MCVNNVSGYDISYIKCCWIRFHIRSMWKPNKWMSLCTKSSRILLSEIVKKVWEISFKSIIMDCCCTTGTVLSVYSPYIMIMPDIPRYTGYQGVPNKWGLHGYKYKYLTLYTIQNRILKRFKYLSQFTILKLTWNQPLVLHEPSLPWPFMGTRKKRAGVFRTRGTRIRFVVLDKVFNFLH